MQYPTYKDLVLDVLLRMGEEGSIQGGQAGDTAIIRAYKKAMPALCKQGLAILSTAGKYIIKSVEITQPGDTEAGRVDLIKIAPDFFNPLYREVWFTNGKDRRRADNFHLEGGRWFVVDPDVRGTWTVYYNAYPALDGEPGEGTELLVDPEVYALLPLFIEGKLRMIHDEDYGTTVLNEFEQRRAELMAETATRLPGGYVTEPGGMGKWL